ncbi:MAG: hypothetical protein K2J67_10640 [Lachnospiraceae bacterium]|nr:hypothetical protein [Lachnospiraceae bacterium]
MPTTSEHNRHMAMLRAAIPYVMPQSRHAIEMLLQADALVNTARGFSQGEDYSLESAEFHDNPEDFPSHGASQNFNPDPENMLLHIQEYCSPRESDLIQTALNFIRAGKLFRGYQEFQMSHPLTQTGETSGGHGMGGHNQLMEFLLSRLNPEQKNIFEQMQQIMYNERCASPERTSYDGENELAES